MKLNNTIPIDINQCASTEALSKIDLSLNKTKIYISTSKYPSIRLALIGEQMDAVAENFISSRVLMERGCGVVAGVWFNNDDINLIDSYRTIVICLDPKVFNDDMDTAHAQVLRTEIEYIIGEARFLSESIAMEIEDLIYDRIQFFGEIGATTPATFDDEHFIESVFAEQEEQMVSYATKVGWEELYQTLTLALIMKYDELSARTIEAFDEVDVYEITKDTILQSEIYKMEMEELMVEDNGLNFDDNIQNDGLNLDDAYSNNGFSLN